MVQCLLWLRRLHYKQRYRTKKKIIEHWVANRTTHIYSDNFLARDLLHRTPGEEVPYPIIKGGLCRWFSHYMLEHSCSSSKGLDRNNLCLTYNIFLFSFFVYETKKLHLNKCLPYKVVHTFLKIHSLHLGFTLQYILTIQKKCTLYTAIASFALEQNIIFSCYNTTFQQ